MLKKTHRFDLRRQTAAGWGQILSTNCNRLLIIVSLGENDLASFFMAIRLVRVYS